MQNLIAIAQGDCYVQSEKETAAPALVIYSTVSFATSSVWSLLKGENQEVHTVRHCAANCTA